ncbi:hypothetical protein CEXT_681111 [Caerostris extrusa]|uniref:Uncharacterized protein n=1 Tax=Caerostris extrusa TaxID=172846 RepID=A0AAV4WKQ9_CAEEX|nr:hypothetical protein CEXT_681111 [Caerostris extrusa]
MAKGTPETPYTTLLMDTRTTRRPTVRAERRRAGASCSGTTTTRRTRSRARCTSACSRDAPGPSPPGSSWAGTCSFTRGETILVSQLRTEVPQEGPPQEPPAGPQPQQDPALLRPVSEDLLLSAVLPQAQGLPCCGGWGSSVPVVRQDAGRQRGHPAPLESPHRFEDLAGSQ